MNKSTIRDLCPDMHSGGTPSTKIDAYWNGDIPWLSSSESGNEFIDEAKQFITVEGVNNSATRLAEKDSVIIATAGEGKTRGQVSYLNIDAYINQSLIAMKPKENQMLPLYLYYYLKNSYSRLRALSDATGVRGSLSGELLGNYEIVYPNIPEQKKIIEVLSSIDNKIKNNNHIIDELKSLITLLYNYWFIQYDYPNDKGLPYRLSGGEMVFDKELGFEIPRGWSCATIEQIAKRVKVGFVGTVDKYYCNSSEGYPIVRPAEMGEDGIDYLGLRHITDEFYNKNRKSQVHKGDILISRCGKDGIPNIYESEKNGQVLNAVIIEPDNNTGPCEFLAETLKSPYVQKQIFNGTSGSVQGVINTAMIGKLKFPYENSIVSMFSEKTRDLYYEIRSARIENLYLVELRNFVLPMLMNGQIKAR